MPARTGDIPTTTSRQTPWQASPPLVGPQADRDRLPLAMTDVLAVRRPASAAEALKMLRLDYPETPLALRIAALCAGSK